MNKIKVIALLSLYFFVVQFSHAQKLENSIFWEISGNGLEKPSYLFGTHHLYDPTSIKNNKTVTEKLDLSEQIVGEITIDMKAILQVMKLATFKGDTTLKSLLTDEQYTKLDKYFTSTLGYSVRMFNTMKPIIVTQMISAQKYAKLNPNKKKNPGSGFGTGMMGASIDGYFQQYGKKKNKKVLGLETVAQQSNLLFNGIPLDKQIEGMMKALDDDGSSSEKELEKLDEYYKTQDLKSIEKVAVNKMSKVEYNTLLKKRNDAWIPKMDKMMKEGSTFFAVGVAHFVGKDGVIKQLRKLGYKFKAIKIQL